MNILSDCTVIDYPKWKFVKCPNGERTYWMKTQRTKWGYLPDSKPSFVEEVETLR